ncbi:hypothetical protein SIN8267_02829 [Sinobacterium norvegicum]|uniref:Peptidase C13 n=1 Tax=Sinobacterium norvegicum TaxID=1641715 RepID=A0ABN8ER01_9GAMM|nr:C13 family peptidase [Sinobacterium norvegicum]CAH0992696.1 hypothetical protein SIN8267_02829 [Sinobacterium norvegicum]
MNTRRTGLLRLAVLLLTLVAGFIAGLGFQHQPMDAVSGGHYSGDRAGGLYHGRGVYVSDDGQSYTGEFSEGYFHGSGELRRGDGYHYSGGFHYGMAEGEGREQLANGDVYIGEFANDQRDGIGQVILAKAVDGVKQYNGRWQRGRLIESDQPQFQDQQPIKTEYALYHQADVLQRQLAAIKAGENDRIELYFIGFAGVGAERVFGRETAYAQALFERQFDTQNRSIALINSKANGDDVILASSTSLQRSLDAVARAMNSEDILFLMITSHGSKSHHLSVQQPGIDLVDISDQQLASMIEQSSIKYKVIMVSACYSGGFIEALQSPNTLVMTSSNSHRSSFGCTDDADFTYFGRAYFQKAMTEFGEHSFESAFYLAKQWVGQWEREQDYQPSQPQIAVGTAVAAQLQRWRSQRGLVDRQQSEHAVITERVSDDY